MGKLLPIYKEHGRTYEADACAPLEQAAEAGRLRLQALVHGHYPGRRLPRQTLDGLKTAGYWDAESDQSWGLDWHRNEGLEFTFLERGTLAFAVDDGRHWLHPNDLTITRPWQPHRVGGPGVTAGRLHWLILDVGVRRPHQAWRWPPWLVLTREDRQELTAFLRHNEQPVWHAGDDLRQCFQQIAQAVDNDRSGSRLSQLTVWLNQLFLLVLELLRQQHVPLDASLTSTQRTVDLFWGDLRGNPDHLAAEWTVPRMARRCGLGVTQFVHLSKQLTNLTPNQYLNRCRLEAAARLLCERPADSVTQIACQCGFSSGQYFATVFRRHFGCSPGAYRHGSDEGITDGCLDAARDASDRG